MLSTVGHGLSPAGAPVTSRCFSFLSCLPPGLSYARSDSAATFWNSSGFLQACPANQPRFDHDSAGNALGLMIEGARQNKCTNTNAAPTTTTGLTISAGSPAVSIVDDMAALTAAGLHQAGNAKVIKIDNSGQATSCSVDFPGACGNTNAHSFSIWARETAGAYGDLRRTGSGTNSVTISGATYTRYKLENETPSSSSNALRVRGNAGAVLYCLLNQLEEGAFASSEIIISGAAATRQQDSLMLSNLDGKLYFDEKQGFMAVRYSLNRAITGSDQYLLVANNGTSAETIGIRVDSTSNALRGYLRNSSVNRHANANGDDHIAGILNAAGLTWQSGSATILSGGLSDTQTYSGDPTGITTLRIGALSSSSSPLWGHVQTVEIGRKTLRLPQLGAMLRRTGDICVVGGGQSLMVGHFVSQETGGAPGRQQFLSTAGLIRTLESIVFVDGATGSSAASKTTQSSNYWWDLATASRGDTFEAFYSAIEDSGIRPTAVIWSQGEQDAHHIGAETSRVQYKQALAAIFSDMRLTLGDIPVFIQKIGRRTSFSNTGGLQAVREVQQEIIDENDWCHFGAETFDQPLYDTVHLTDSGYTAAGNRLARKVLAQIGENLNGVEGPSVTGAVRSGTTVTVTISHDDGSDFTPSSDIQGFHFFDDTTEISITASVRTNATTITLSLASAPSGTETLYYIYDADLSLDTSKVVFDDASVPMPLRTALITL